VSSAFCDAAFVSCPAQAVDRSGDRHLLLRALGSQALAYRSQLDLQADELPGYAREGELSGLERLAPGGSVRTGRVEADEPPLHFVATSGEQCLALFSPAARIPNSALKPATIELGRPGLARSGCLLCRREGFELGPSALQARPRAVRPPPGYAAAQSRLVGGRSVAARSPAGRVAGSAAPGQPVTGCSRRLRCRSASRPQSSLRGRWRASHDRLRPRPPTRLRELRLTRRRPDALEAARVAPERAAPIRHPLAERRSPRSSRSCSWAAPRKA